MLIVLIDYSGKALAGVCRAAFRTDAYILDSGVGSGIEKFCLRKSKINFNLSLQTLISSELLLKAKSLILGLIQPKEETMSLPMVTLTSF